MLVWDEESHLVLRKVALSRLKGTGGTSASHLLSADPGAGPGPGKRQLQGSPQGAPKLELQNHSWALHHSSPLSEELAARGRERPGAHGPQERPGRAGGLRALLAFGPEAEVLALGLSVFRDGAKLKPTPRT